jgi:O-antigen ligase
VTLGLVGLLTYVGLFAAAFRTFAGFMRQGGDARVVGIGFTSMTVAYIIHNCFIFDTSANFLTFFMLLAFVTHLAVRGMDAGTREQGAGNRVKRVPWTGMQVVTAGALGVLVTIFDECHSDRGELCFHARDCCGLAG